MEDYLRLGLLVLAVVIVLLIFFEGWFRRRLSRSHDYSEGDFNPDAVLGLELKTTSALATDPAAASTATITSSAEFKQSQAVDQVALDLNEIDIAMSVDDSISTTAAIAAPVVKPKTTLSDLLVISVVAKPGRVFASYDLLQAIAATGMQYGDMNIFHYHKMDGVKRDTLFSLASATEPGDFDLDKMGDFSCSGLTLFTQLREVPDPQEAFELMLKTADQLVEDLDGELRSNPRLPWNDEILLQYQQKVLQFQLMNEA